MASKKFLPATPANMKKLIKKAGQPIAVPGVFAWSPYTDEEYSASPGDYWDRDPDAPLLDSDGNAMVLVRRVSRNVPA